MRDGEEWETWDMDIVDGHTHRVLAYIAAVSRQGYEMSIDEVEAFAKRPERQGPVVRNAFEDWRASIMSSVFTTEEPGETFVAHLRRLMWVTTDDNRKVRLTRLGFALLRELSSPKLDPETESTIEVLLDPSDPFAYSRVLTSLSDVASGLLVDPYFRVSQFYDIATQTTIDRILLGKKIGTTEISKLAFALASVPDERPLELRIASSLHDRYVIPPEGAVRFIGTSLGGVGKSVSAVGTFSTVTSDAIRAEHERLWSEATKLGPAERGQVSPEQ